MWQEFKSELKAELRRLASDREMWAWFAVALVVVVGGVAVIAWQMPGLPGVLAWAAAFSAWIIALNVRMAKRGTVRENQPRNMMFSVGLHVWIEVDQAANELLPETEQHHTWYRVSVSGCQIGRIEHCPESGVDRRWMACLQGGAVPRASGHHSKRGACEALIKHALTRQ
jgi:hypothetical protein